MSTFDGLPLGGSAVLVKYTLMSDANLDGSVNGADYNTAASNFNTSGQTWTGGSFDYSGNVAGPDYNMLLANFKQTLANVLTQAILRQQALVPAQMSCIQIGLEKWTLCCILF
jgi:hypothetical protein